MALGQPLQGGEGVIDYQEVGIGILLAHHLALGDNKVAHTTPIKFRDITMTIVAGGRQGKKQRFLRETKRTTVGEQKTHLSTPAAYAPGTNKSRYLFYSVFHNRQK